MKRAAAIAVAAWWIAGATLGVLAASAGLAVGVDPTGLWLVSALTETAIAPSFDLRAVVGFAVSEGLSGLMLATTSILFHVPISPFDPFAGAGVGAALTPPPYTSALVLEAVAGVRIISFEPFGFFAQARYLVRWSSDGWTAGPVFETGAYLRF